MVIFILVYVLSVILRSVIPQSRLSKMHKLERLLAIIDAQAREVNRRAKATKIDFLRHRLNKKADKLQKKANTISAKIEELK